MTDKQKGYIASLTRRLMKTTSQDHPLYKHLNYGLTASFTTQEASDWIAHLRELIFAHNSTVAIHSVDGGRSRRGQI